MSKNEIISIKCENNAKMALSEFERRASVALEECGMLCEKYAKKLCPVDTGRLRNSIAHTVKIERRESAAYIGTNVEYGPFVEFGTRRSRAQPFLRPAVRDHAETYRRIIKNTMEGGTSV